MSYADVSQVFCSRSYSKWIMLLRLLCPPPYNQHRHCSGSCRRDLVCQYSLPSLICSQLTRTLQIQEGGLSFYSYLILIRVLKGRSRTIFMSLFWSGIVIIVAVRTGILTERARDILQNTTDRQNTIDHLHNVYFGTIALVECNSAFFLLRKLAFAHKSSIEAASGHKLFVYLMRSTEIRVAMLALIGFSRTITYSFQTTAQSATSTMGQLDRFVVTLECLFPEMML
jgi:hypothetical protein